jgi:hypothetical protein
MKWKNAFLFGAMLAAFAAGIAFGGETNQSEPPAPFDWSPLSDPSVQEACRMIENQGEFSNPYSAYRRFVRNLPGEWVELELPHFGSGWNPNPRGHWSWIRFSGNGTVEIGYDGKEREIRMDEFGNPQRAWPRGGKREPPSFAFRGTWEAINKRTERLSRRMNVVIRPEDGPEGCVVLLEQAFIGEASYFPPHLPVLWFRDRDGYDYAFYRPDIGEEERIRLLNLDHVYGAEGPGTGKNAEPKRETLPPGELLGICRRLQEEDLGDCERCNEILRLQQKGDESCVPVLVAHLDGRWHSTVRERAIRALGEIGGEKAEAALADFLCKPIAGDFSDNECDEAVLRRVAVGALGKTGGVRALECLRSLARSNREYRDVQERAVQTIRVIESKTSNALTGAVPGLTP